jgi:hypothetical protein
VKVSFEKLEAQERRGLLEGENPTSLINEPVVKSLVASYPKAIILKSSRVDFNIKGNDYRSFLQLAATCASS